MGKPKALVRDPDGTSWLARAVGVLADGGCDGVTVVVGAATEEARTLLDDLARPDVAVVLAEDWASGMGASLRAGLAALADTSAPAALVHLVDLPDVTAEVVRRVLAAGSGGAVLARAAYGGAPGHPVLLGRDHWAGVAATAEGDQGARTYLASHEVSLVECGDLAAGHDQDTPGPGTNH